MKSTPGAGASFPSGQTTKRLMGTTASGFAPKSGSQFQHTFTAFEQHLSDKQPKLSNEIETLTSIIRPQKVA